MEVLDSLLSGGRRCCEGFPDKRTGTNSQYTMADIGLAALSVFFTQSPSFRAVHRAPAWGLDDASARRACVDAVRQVSGQEALGHKLPRAKVIRAHTARLR